MFLQRREAVRVRQSPGRSAGLSRKDDSVLTCRSLAWLLIGALLVPGPMVMHGLPTWGQMGWGSSNAGSEGSCDCEIPPEAVCCSSDELSSAPQPEPSGVQLLMGCGCGCGSVGDGSVVMPDPLGGLQRFADSPHKSLLVPLPRAFGTGEDPKQHREGPEPPPPPTRGLICSSGTVPA